MYSFIFIFYSDFVLEMQNDVEKLKDDVEDLKVVVHQPSK